MRRAGAARAAHLNRPRSSREVEAPDRLHTSELLVAFANDTDGVYSDGRHRPWARLPTSWRRRRHEFGRTRPSHRTIGERRFELLCAVR